MDKYKLISLKNVLDELEYANSQLAEMLDLMNLTESERNRIEDAMLITIEKIDVVKVSKISQLEDHVDFSYL